MEAPRADRMNFAFSMTSWSEWFRTSLRTFFDVLRKVSRDFSFNCSLIKWSSSGGRFDRPGCPALDRRFFEPALVAAPALRLDPPLELLLDDPVLDVALFVFALFVFAPRYEKMVLLLGIADKSTPFGITAA